MLFTGSPDDSEDCVMGPQRFRYTVASEPLELFDSQSSALLIAPPRPDDKLSAIIAHRLLQDCVFVDDECALAPEQNQSAGMKDSRRTRKATCVCFLMKREYSLLLYLTKAVTLPIKIKRFQAN
ncbi:hypothetical protein QQF64_010776 [Cirrhinus molitorella]|uniref:Uncharacterized protein n=1 Tax=Cirrhinus molitorella TaxID=172907 RepID=A0ABR3M0X6_9TELE